MDSITPFQSIENALHRREELLAEADHERLARQARPTSARPTSGSHAWHLRLGRVLEIDVRWLGGRDRLSEVSTCIQ